MAGLSIRDREPGTRPSLLRRCALGIWLCAIALLGLVEFRRHAFATGDLSMTPVAWLWLAGSTLTGIVGIALLLRELRRQRDRS